jgi:hypothetical protein
MTSFANLKRNRDNMEKLTKALETTTQSSDGGKDDDRFWQPSVDKVGNGMAVIRFLPESQVDGDDALPWVRVFSHGFQGPGGWFIDNCLTTINQKCPVCDHNSVLWNSGIEANKEIVRKQKRKLNYIANVYIVSDPSNPENEGKVKLFKFGKKIFDKLDEAMNPEFADESPINPFDMWEGANFKLKIRKVEGYRNYDKSEFDKSGALFDDDAKLEEIWKSEHSLKEFIDPKLFKSADKLKERLDKVLGGVTQESVPTAVERKFAAETETLAPPKAKASPSLDEDDELDYFKSLADSE